MTDRQAGTLRPNVVQCNEFAFGGFEFSRRTLVRKMILPIAAGLGLLLGSIATGQSQQGARQPGASGLTPGHEMQENGPASRQPGASGYAAGHEKSLGRDSDDRIVGSGGRDRDDPSLRDRDDRGTIGRGDRDRDDRMGADRDRR